MTSLRGKLIHEPLISVVIPAFERAHLLCEALQSVTLQDMPVEVIVVDDSRPSHREAVRLVAESVEGVRYNISGPYSGASAARNWGACLATGKYLAFLDDDDMWLSSYLREIVRSIRSYSPDIVLDGFQLLHGSELRPEKRAPHRLRAEEFFRHNPGLRGSNLVIRRDLYFATGGFDVSLRSMNDLDFGIRLSRMPGVRYKRLDNQRVVFRQHAGWRVSRPGTREKIGGVKAFWARYGPHMGELERGRFRRRMLVQFEVEL